jgi:formylglycine-generating enzyme required for sulfatase activity
MAVEDENLTEPPADMQAALSARGLRMPSSDEWEHACGAGSDSLFRWGDDCPLDRIPYGDDTGPHNELNAYRAELTSDVTAVHGGDGGESVCGGYGHLLAWLPLATANRNPAMAEFVYGPDGEDMYEDFSTRPVLPL